MQFTITAGQISAFRCTNRGLSHALSFFSERTTFVQQVGENAMASPHRAKGINPELKNKKAGSGFHRTPP